MSQVASFRKSERESDRSLFVNEIEVRRSQPIFAPIFEQHCRSLVSRYRQSWTLAFCSISTQIPDHQGEWRMENG